MPNQEGWVWITVEPCKTGRDSDEISEQAGGTTHPYETEAEADA